MGLYRTIAIVSLFASVSACGPGRNLSQEMRLSSMEIIGELASGFEDEQAFVANSLNTLANKMKDPSSVQFRNERVVEYNNGHLVCGEYNAKNSYGAYVGFSPFAASPKGAVTYYHSKFPSIEDDSNVGLVDACG